MAFIIMRIGSEYSVSITCQNAELRKLFELSVAVFRIVGFRTFRLWALGLKVLGFEIYWGI